MDVITGVAILIIVIIAISIIVVAIGNNQRRKNTERLLSELSFLGTARDLSFTSQELLGNRLIGLDGLKRKFLFIEEMHGEYNPLIIDLDTIKSCTVKMKYIGYTITRKRLNPEEYLEKIYLQFEATDKKLIDVPFYVFDKDDISQKRALETKARDWEAILSKMIVNKDAKIA